MYDYYDFLIKEEFAKLRFDLEKYYEPERYNKHIEIIEYYADLFLGDLIKYRDTIYRRCYSLLVVHLNLLKDYILNYFEPDKNVTKDFKTYEKLDWIGDIESFVNFFNDLINSGRILYNGKRDIVKIFQILIYYINVQDLKRLNELLGCKVPNITRQSQIEKIKLHWQTNLKDFAKIFAPIFHNRILLFIGEINLTRMAYILCKIFVIIGEKRKIPVTPEGLRKALYLDKSTNSTKENNFKQ